MRELVPGLLATEPQQLSFAPSLEVRAYLLRRDQGNLLIYGAETLAGESGAIEERGGVSRHYLNHWHEAMFTPAGLAAPRFIHEADRPPAVERIEISESFSGPESLGEDFELIPTPGHTPGATAFLWRRNGHRYLFTGDTLYLDRGEWVAGVLESSDREALAGSLELIRELDFDILVPWATTRGQPPMSPAGPDQRRRRIDAILAEIRPGARAAAPES